MAETTTNEILETTQSMTTIDFTGKRKISVEKISFKKPKAQQIDPEIEEVKTQFFFWT